MDSSFSAPHRRDFLAALGCLAASLPFAGSARAAGLSGTLANVLSQAMESSLDKLAQPNAFYDDPAIRIGLPMLGGGQGGGLGGGLSKGIGSALDFGRQFGLTDKFTRLLNDAASVAAAQAKPVFRSAIGQLQLTDVPGIATQNDGATQYLQRSAGDELKQQLRPVVDSALMRSGALSQLDKLVKKSRLLRSAGITRDGLGGSVTDQALGGMFKYIGAEEGRLRANPLDAAGGLLKGILGN